jgi:large subunit ribosomal protein L18
VNSVGKNTSAGTAVAKLFADSLLQKGVSRAVFDKSGYKFHGVVKSIKDTIQTVGIKV